ncbi:hypothetical protein CEE37_09020 [candidate division LCP-89 bacterium B3_LCP]|uniref:YncE family protein n=1 Tax=candidate division LCP-89 bacterium B3_LCP TaxID=2012998 RepID=A0A532UZQ5_UNCL8|nr:MAG: hypothetical protein CEE37_09020 [candidate division LCP-89 bacterium B3_LCP]
MRKCIVLGVIMLIFFGCTNPTDPPDPENQSGLIAWVVNSLGGTLSKVDLTSGAVTVNAITVGDAPNDIVIDDSEAFVVNSLSDNVQVIDLDSEQSTGTIEIYQGINPYSIALDDESRAFVTNLMTGNISVLDLATGVEIDTLQTGTALQGICISGDFLYFTDINLDMVNFTYDVGELFIFSLQTLTFVGVVEVGINPQAVKMGPDGNLHVICTGDYAGIPGQIDVVDPAAQAVIQTIPVGGTPGSVAFTSNGTAYVGAAGWGTDGKVYSYDANSYQVFHDDTNPIAVPSAAMGVAVIDDDHILVCCFSTDQLVELDSSGNIINTFDVGDGPVAVAASGM